MSHHAHVFSDTTWCGLHTSHCAMSSAFLSLSGTVGMYVTPCTCLQPSFHWYRVCMYTCQSLYRICVELVSQLPEICCISARVIKSDLVTEHCHNITKPLDQVLAMQVLLNCIKKPKVDSLSMSLHCSLSDAILVLF